MKQNGTSTMNRPAVPDARFREELQRALEETHRQQLAQRQLELDSPHEISGGRRRWAGLFGKGLATTALLALAFGLGFYLGRRGAPQP